jgi:hypothetical protein
MKYDAKTLPVSEQSWHFRRSMETINTCLTHIKESEPYLSVTVNESVLKIIDRFDSLPPGEDTEAVEGLSQLLCTLSARISEVLFAQRFMFDREFVPATTLAKIIKHPDFQTATRNMAERICSQTPRHLFDPEG